MAFYRRWTKIGSGVAVGVTTIIALFVLLQLNFGFIITDLTGNITCEGSYENPCISEFLVKNPTKYNVDIYSKDQVKLDFSPEIYDYALFIPDGRCSATGTCACDLKDGRKLGFEDWRCVDFTNKTKSRGDVVYNYRFSDYSTTKFRLAGLKLNPEDNIKWSFAINGSELDPIWLPSGKGNRTRNDVFERRQDGWSKNYTARDNRIIIKNQTEDRIFDLQLISSNDNLVPSGTDVLVAEFQLREIRTNKLFDSISSYEVNKNRNISKIYRFKYALENNTLECEDRGKNCVNITDIKWIEFNSVSELPRKDAKIGLFTDTTVIGETVEWIPTIEGFELDEWATFSVQRGTSAMTTLVLDVVLSEPVNNNTAFVAASVAAVSSVEARLQVTATLINTTTLRLEKFSTGSSTIAWQIIDSSALSVIRGERTYNTADENFTVDIPEVNLTNSFIIVQNRLNSTSTDGYTAGLWTGRFHNASKLSFARAATGRDGNLSWQVVSWEGAYVQSGSTSASADVIINQVNTSSSFIIHSSNSSNIQTQNSLIRSYFVNSSIISLHRESTTGTATAEWFVVEAPRTNVQVGNAVFTSNSLQSFNINQINESRTFTLHSFEGGTANTKYGQVQTARILFNATRFDLQKGQGISSSNNSWFIIELYPTQVPFACGQTLSSSNTQYNLTQNLNSDGTCFTVTGENITLDGAGFSIIGNQSGQGISALNISSFTVWNLSISNFSLDIDMTSGGTSVLPNLTIRNSNLSTIVANGFGGGDGFGGEVQTGNAGFVTVYSSNITNITAKGGYTTVTITSVPGGNGSTINVYNSKIIKTVDASGGNAVGISGNARGGHGGNIYLFGDLNLSGVHINVRGGTPVGLADNGIAGTLILNYTGFEDRDANYGFNYSRFTLINSSTSGAEISVLNINSENLSNLSINTKLKFNFAELNISNPLNKTANVTLRGTPSTGLTSPIIAKDGVACGSECYNFTSLTGTVVVFNVTSWSNYSLIDGADVISPYFYNLVVSPSSPTTYSSGTTYQFNSSWADNTAIDKVQIEFDGTNVTIPIANGNAQNATYNYTLRDLHAGSYNYYWWANDTTNNKNQSTIETYTINRATTTVSLYLNGTQGNITITQGQSVYINATRDQGEGIMNISQDGVLFNSGNPPLFNLTNFTNVGDFNFTAFQNQTQNYTASTVTWFVQVVSAPDITNPDVVNLTQVPSSPTTYSPGGKYEFNATVLDNIAVDKVLLEIAGINYTASNLTSNRYNVTIFNLAAGTHTGRWIANDTSSNVNNTETFSYTINRATPTGTISNNGTFSYPTLTSVTGSESNNGDGDVTYTLFRNGTSASNPDSVTLGVGTYNYTFNSTIGENYTALILDSRLLTISQNNTYIITVSGTTPITYGTPGNFQGNGCPSEITCVLYRNNTQVSSPDTTILGVGTYVYHYNSTGNANYSSNQSVSQNLIVNQNTSLIFTYLNNLRSNVSITQNDSIYLNVTQITGDSGATLRLYNNGTLINEGTSKLSNLTLFNETGIFNISGFYVGTDNYTGTFEEWYVTVNPQENITSNMNVSYGFFTPQDNVWLSKKDLFINLVIQNISEFQNTTYNLFGEEFAITTFNNSLSSENLSFYENQTITRYIDIPKGIYINTVTFNISGNSSAVWDYDDFENRTIDTSKWLNKSVVGNGAGYHRENNGSLQIESKGAEGGGGFYGLNVTAIAFPGYQNLTSIQFESRYTQRFGSGGIVIARILVYDQLIFNYMGDGNPDSVDNVNWSLNQTIPGNFSVFRNGVLNSTINVTILNTPNITFVTYADGGGSLSNFNVTYLNYTSKMLNPTIEIGTPDNNYEFNHIDYYESSNNQTQELAGIVNALFDGGDCTGGISNGDNCSIPVNFRLASSGVLRYYDIKVNNNNGILNVTTYTDLDLAANINWTLLPEGNYTYNTTSFDSTRNDTPTRKIQLDRIYPLIVYNAETDSEVSDADFNTKSNIFVSVNASDANFVNITFFLYNITGLQNKSTFADSTRTINWTGLTYGMYFYNVTASDLASNLNTTTSRMYGATFINFTLEDNTDNLVAELGSEIELDALFSNGTICLDIDHPSFGTNYTCGDYVINSTITIDNFRKTTFFDSSNNLTLNFNSSLPNNETEYILALNITGHQYDIINGLSFNINASTGIPKDVAIYLINTTTIERKYQGYLLGDSIYLNTSFNGSASEIISIPTGGVKQFIYFSLDDNIGLYNFTFNATGQFFGNESFNNLSLFENIDNSLSNAQQNTLGVLMANATNKKLFTYDEFEDGVLDTRWLRSADYIFSETCSIISRVREEGDAMLLENLWRDINNFCSGTTTTISASNISLLNWYTSDDLNFNISSTYSSSSSYASSSCDGVANIYTGGTEIWESFYLEDPGGSDESESSSAFLNINISRQNNTKLVVHITGMESSSVFLGSPYGTRTTTYNWTNNSYLQSDDTGTMGGNLTNKFNVTINDVDSAIYVTNRVTKNKECTTALVNTRIWYMNNTLYQRSNATVISSPISVSGSISKAIINLSAYTYTGYSGLNTSVWLSADNGTNWDNIALSEINQAHAFSFPGNLLRWRVDFNFSSGEGAYYNDSTWVDDINITIASGYPTNLTIDFGNDGNIDANVTLILNETTSPVTVTIPNINLSNAFANATKLYPHTGKIPLVFNSTTPGLLTIDNINLTYNPNPIIINHTLVETYLSSKTNYTNYSIPVASSLGNITISDLRLDYAGGNQSVKFLAHNQDYTYNITRFVTYYFSQWDYEFGPRHVDFLEFIPRNALSKNVTPFGQITATPILNITSQGYHPLTTNLSLKVNETINCINITVSTDSSKANGSMIGLNWTELRTNIPYLGNTKIWMWADYACSTNQNWTLYEPSFYFRSCANSTICSEVI